MTTAIFLILFFGFFVAILNYLPLADPANSELLNAVYYFVGIMKAWNWLFPISELFTCVGIVIGYQILVWTWFHVLVPVTARIRGSTH